MRTLFICAIITLLSGCTSIKPIYSESMSLNEAQQKGFKTYEKLKDHRIFVASDNGAYSTTRTENVSTDLLQYALSLCQKRAAGPCRLLSLDGQDYLQEYAKFNKASAQAINSMRIKSEQYRFVEQQDWLIPEPEQLRTIDEGVHFATPMHLDGVKTIDTASLVEAMKADKIQLLDAMGFGNSDSVTIPNSYVFDGVGLAYGAQSEHQQQDTLALENLDMLMKKIAPEKSQAIAVFCASPECWLSVNAIMRLRSLGYTNLYWYRGGLTAWMVAQLPTVKAVPFATVWSKL